GLGSVQHRDQPRPLFEFRTTDSVVPVDVTVPDDPALPLDVPSGLADLHLERGGLVLVGTPPDVDRALHGGTLLLIVGLVMRSAKSRSARASANFWSRGSRRAGGPFLAVTTRTP